MSDFAAINELVAFLRAKVDRSRLEQHLQNHPTLDLAGSCRDGATVIHWAAMLGRLDDMRWLIERGAPADIAVAASGMQPIHWACTTGQQKCVQSLIELSSVDSNALDRKRTPPLMIAVQYGHVSLVEYLLRRGADPSMVDEDGDSALHWAAYKNRDDCLERLASSSAGFEVAVDSFGSTPLHLAASQGSCRAMAWLLRCPKVAVALAMKDKRGRTPLEVATQRDGHAIRRMLEAHAEGRSLDADDFGLQLPPMDMWLRDAGSWMQGLSMQLSERVWSVEAGGGAAAAAGTRADEEAAAAAGRPIPGRVLEMVPVSDDGGELI